MILSRSSWKCLKESYICFKQALINIIKVSNNYLVMYVCLHFFYSNLLSLLISLDLRSRKLYLYFPVYHHNSKSPILALRSAHKVSKIILILENELVFNYCCIVIVLMHVNQLIWSIHNKTTFLCYMKTCTLIVLRTVALTKWHNATWR